MTSTRFVRACRRQPVDRVPVWLMRQAGRFQPEYRALKDRVGGFLSLCTDPAALAEATLFAQRSLDTDAAIIFSDITLVGWAMGLPLDFSPGPVYERAVRTRDEVDALKSIEPARDLPYLMEGIQMTRAGLADDVSLIGFVGAPLTVAGYMVEGAPGRGWPALKRMLYDEPALAERLLERVGEALAAHAIAQVEAGCDALQIFDTTAGELPPAELRGFAFAPARTLIERLRPSGVPIIYFARNIGAHLETAADLGADVLGIDWTVTISEARRRLGDAIALMGNLDPNVLLCSGDTIETRVHEILRQAKGHPGFIFNLGHGVLRETPPENARRVVEAVRSFRP